MRNLPKKDIRIVKKEIKPIFEVEEGKLFKKKVIKYIKNKGIDYEKLDRVGKIKVMQKLINGCKRCDLRDKYKPVIPYIPKIKPDAGFITTNPAKIESQVGIPLHSLSKGGDMFDKYLDILDLERDSIYISNLVHCHNEISKVIVSNKMAKCALWKYIEFDLIDIPKFIFTLGTYPLKMFMGFNSKSIMNVFGDIYLGNFRGKEIYIIPMIHPGYILRDSDYRNDVKNLLSYVKENLFEEV